MFGPVFWNQCSTKSLQQAPSLSTFKKLLYRNCPSTNSWYYTGSRKLGQIHARLRMGCSNLHSDLFSLHVCDNASCSCGHPIEDATHYLLYCPLYVRQRIVRDTKIYNLNLPPNIHIDCNLLLYGSEDISFELNDSTVRAVHKFINDTSRF